MMLWIQNKLNTCKVCKKKIVKWILNRNGIWLIFSLCSRRTRFCESEFQSDYRTKNIQVKVEKWKCWLLRCSLLLAAFQILTRKNFIFLLRLKQRYSKEGKIFQWKMSHCDVRVVVRLPKSQKSTFSKKKILQY